MWGHLLKVNEKISFTCNCKMGAYRVNEFLGNEEFATELYSHRLGF